MLLIPMNSLSLLLVIVTAYACQQFEDAVIPHGELRPLPQMIPDSDIGQLYLRFQPYLYILNGCRPFPAVDAEGNIGGGLNPSGNPRSGCHSSTGQVYARSGTHSGHFAIMYSWYWPKDSPSTRLGHRHDWEDIVVWLTPSLDGIEAVSASGHGKHDVDREPKLHDGAPCVAYSSVWPVNHRLGFTRKVGGRQPLVAWESITRAAREGLDTADFGKATVPFKDATFAANLESASP